MATDLPDYVNMVQVAVTVDLEPVVPQGATEVAAGGVGRYSGADLTYQTVQSWTVTAGKVGKLTELSMVSNNYPKTLWKVVIGTETFMEDDVIKTRLTLPFNDLPLAAARVVTIYCKSSDGTSIVCDGSISGKEVG